MIERYRPKPEPKKRGGNYFQASAPLQFIRSGCTLLDCSLAGPQRYPEGCWPLGRMVNIVGDKSTGKTLLAIEACANFARDYPKGKIFYREAEAAFDTPYATTVGLPLERVNFGVNGPDTLWETIEQVFADLDAVLTTLEKSGEPGLYIIDSLDALSAEAILKRGVDGLSGYNLEKPKVLGQLFQQMVRRIKQTRLCLIIISQVRDRIGVVFGDQHSRSGGNAMDFYATYILWLHHVANLTREIQGQKRVVGVRIRARCKKNKVWTPHRECEFPIMFGYGVDDLAANLNYLKQAGAPDYDGLLKTRKAAEQAGGASLDQFMRQIADATARHFAAIEAGFAPPRAKYGEADVAQ